VSTGTQKNHPTAEDVLLIIEVSDTTLRFDRDVKAGLYARHGIPEYWIVDVNEHRIHVLREPRDGKYTTESTVGGGVIVVPVLQTEIDLAQLFF
jgi:Uma2 family endonuclease